ncbi:MAG: HAD family hydrolase [Planctomycetales bacterium]|nr:HAD family hydrolase [Planctomycetales bacterium]
MSSTWYDPVVQHRSELFPLATDVEPILKSLRGIKAVIFDVYGTLVISGSGDVGSANSHDSGRHIDAAMDAVGIPGAGGRRPTVDDLHRRINASNMLRKSESCPQPEVDIVDVWRQTLIDCGIHSATTEQINRLAARYEAAANPTWPMPGAAELLEKLRHSGLTLGIVSNAQGFTLPLVEDLDGRFGVDSVFDLNLCVFSCRYRHGKPGPRLFEVLCGGLQRVGISPREAIYVGNDRLNDVWAATRAGLRTAWFAGDRRSLRPRADDSRVANLDHDIVLTQLTQLLDCI